MGDRHIGEISARKEMVDLVRHEVAEVQNFVKSGNQFLKITRSFIANSVREGKLTQIKGRTYFKEAMHAILFCGRINIPLINPEEMMEHHEFQLLSEIYPDAFQKYNSHLPKRPPYAVLLGAVVEIIGTDINEVLKCLTDLNRDMLVEFTGNNCNKLGNIFISEVISCCYLWDVTTREKTDNYFGAVVSVRGRQQKEIMFDILCCQTWHLYISLAVCISKKFNKISLRFPPELQIEVVDTIHSGQYDLPSGVQVCNSLESSPYKLCFDIYINNNSNFEFDISAKCEALSQLLYANRQIAEKLEFLDTSILMNSTKLTNYKRLKNNLKLLEFNVGQHLQFYDPNE
ncbi:uncharacterized protein LOC122547215 isoform X1 [Chiloscyllium plagiosum]|uniref:uncharacterized protein LOC122547215 isoform X1 n=1 Tax=Chiloscyllium plagiosum TaxID=36176 RepID=UPI001CB824BD|nr:uncharacterized protein LOC122547215 isoform X1 [Chiloscyllium plagiosum]